MKWSIGDWEFFEDNELLHFYHPPSGARGVLRHAGTDASDAFTELHSQSIFAAFASQYRIGRLDPADCSAAAAV